MTFDEFLNYTVLSNKIDKEFLSLFGNYQIIDYNISYNDLIKKLELYPSKRIVFNNTFYNLKESEIKNIIDLLNKENVKFTNITTNIEQVLLTDYIIVYHDGKKTLEGNTKEVLENELELKHEGYGIPFAVDLSTQLKYYDILDKTYYDLDSLTEDLWN